jgi:hypothetical protein
VTGWPPDEPWQQDLPACWRHPSLSCPGECQYIIPREACWHDLDAETTEPEERDIP